MTPSLIRDVFSTTKASIHSPALCVFIQLWNTFHEPDRVEAGLRDSLNDLGLDYVDLLIMHWPMAFKVCSRP